MTRYAVVAALPGLMFAIGACSTAPPKLLPPPVAPLVSPLPRKMSSLVPLPSPVADRRPNPVGLTCEPDAAPRFDDPDNPNAITNKACGYVSGNGNARSSDPWIDDQLQATRGEPAFGADPCAGLTYEQCHGIQDPPVGSTPAELASPPATLTTTPTAPTGTSVPTSSPPAETTSGSPTDSRSPTTTGSPTTSDAPTTSGSGPTTTGRPTTG